MKKEPLLLVGAGGHARSCIDVIEEEDKYLIIGLTGLPTEVGERVLGYEILGTDDDLRKFQKFSRLAFVSVGQVGVSNLRHRLFSELKNTGFKIPTIVSPLAHVSRHSRIGEGTIVMHRATINAGARVGNNCIINSHSLIEHDVSVGNDSHISTSVVLNGGCAIGMNCFIGSNTTVREEVQIGDESIVSMGSIVKVSQPFRSRKLHA